MALDDVPNKLESVWVQRNTGNQYYEQINISGSNLIVYHSSSGELQADKISVFAAKYGLGGNGLSTGSTYPITSSWAISASWAPPPDLSVYLSSSQFTTWVSSSNSFFYGTASYALTAISVSYIAYTQSMDFVSSASWASSSISASYVPARRKVFDSINALATSTFVIENDEPVIVRGYYTVGDWGQERFAKYTSSTSETANIGNVFTSSMGGRFIFDDRNEPVQNIKWWGAKGDGVTDDYTSISASLAFSNHLEVPVGRYIHTQPIIINTNEPISIKSKVGSYQGGWLSYSNVQEAEFIYSGSPINASWDITAAGTRYGNDFENIAFDASGSANYAIQIGKMGRSSFKSVRANNAIIANFFLSSSQFVYFERCSTSVNDDNPQFPTQYGLLLDSFSPCNQFIDCTFENSTVYGVYLGFNSINNTFIGCAIESNDGGGLFVKSTATNNTFDNIWFEANSTASHDIQVDTSCFLNTFRNIFINDRSASVSLSGSYNTFDSCIFGQFNVSPNGSRNKIENCLYYYTSSDASGFNDYRNFINAPATFRKNTISSTITVTGAVTASAGFRGRLHDTASYALTASFIGAGTNNYLPKWLSNTLTATSSIYDNNTNVGIGSTSPSSKLHVSGDGSVLRLERSADPNQYILINEDATGHSILGYSPNNNRKVLVIGTSHSVAGGNSGVGHIYFNTSGSTKSWIDEMGNFLPYVTNTYNLGSVTRNWNYVHANYLVGTAALAITSSYALSASFFGGGTNNYLPKWNSNRLTFTSSIFDNNINVGIGTILPTSKLHILANDSLLKLTRSDLSTQYLEVTEDALGHSIIGYSPNGNKKVLTIGTSHSLDSSAGSAGYIYFNTSGSTKVWIDETGNLLPYVTATYDLGSPAKRWNNIYANNLLGTASFATSASWAHSASWANESENSNSSSIAESASFSLTASYIGSGTNNYLPKWNSNRLTSTSSLYDDNINVGIGTTSPTSKLHILANDSLLKLNRSDILEQYLEITEDATGHNIFGYSPNSNRKVLNIGTTHSIASGDTGAGYIYFSTSGSTKVWIDEVGNLLPYVHNLYDLGSPTRYWNNIYANLLLGTSSYSNYSDTSLSSSYAYTSSWAVSASWAPSSIVNALSASWASSSLCSEKIQISLVENDSEYNMIFVSGALGCNTIYRDTASNFTYNPGINLLYLNGNIRTAGGITGSIYTSNIRVDTTLDTSKMGTNLFVPIIVNGNQYYFELFQ